MTIPRETETERLILRQFCQQDLEPYARMLADPQVMQYVGKGQPLDRTQAWQNLAMLLGHWQLRGFGLWALVRQSDAELIGRVGLYHPEGWPGLEIGWLLRRDCWGFGFASEAAGKVREIAAASMPQEELISLIHPLNQRSASVSRRIGGRLQRQLSILNQTVDVYHYPLDH